MANEDRVEINETQIEWLTRELEEAELFTQSFTHSLPPSAKRWAAGRVGRALSMCNQALTEIDSATDVVSPSPHLKERAGLEADYAPQSGKRD